MGIIAWIILCLVAGVIAKALVPGRDPQGLIVTTLIGAAGTASVPAARTAGQAAGETALGRRRTVAARTPMSPHSGPAPGKCGA